MRVTIEKFMGLRRCS